MTHILDSPSLFYFHEQSFIEFFQSLIFKSISCNSYCILYINYVGHTLLCALFEITKIFIIETERERERE